MDITVTTPETLRVGRINVALPPMLHFSMTVEEAYRLCAEAEAGHETNIRAFLVQLRDTFISNNL